MSADCAASCISAALTSGRRRIRSAGMSTITSSSACGIVSLASTISGSGPGGRASKVLSALCAWRTPISQAGAARARRRARPALLVLAAPDDVSGRLLDLRIARAAGDAELGARLHDPQAGGPHVGIDPQCLGDEPIEHRIVEAAPPFERLL